MPKKYVSRTTAQKKEYAKNFTKKEVDAYRKGKRAGFLNGVHAPKKISN